jgi:hypothetical protein
MAVHLVHEAALCVSGLRKHRSLTQKGFELSNGMIRKSQACWSAAGAKVDLLHRFILDLFAPAN